LPSHYLDVALRLPRRRRRRQVYNHRFLACDAIYFLLDKGKSGVCLAYFLSLIGWPATTQLYRFLAKNVLESLSVYHVRRYYLPVVLDRLRLGQQLLLLALAARGPNHLGHQVHLAIVEPIEVNGFDEATVQVRTDHVDLLWLELALEELARNGNLDYWHVLIRHEACCCLVHSNCPLLG